jgi:hypothetical protein
MCEYCRVPSGGKVNFGGIICHVCGGYTPTPTLYLIHHGVRRNHHCFTPIGKLYCSCCGSLLSIAYLPCDGNGSSVKEQWDNSEPQQFTDDAYYEIFFPKEKVIRR